MDYKYIRAWGKLLSSFDYYIELQVALARQDHAPEDAIYRKSDGTWARASAITSPDTKADVEAIVSTIK